MQVNFNKKEEIRNEKSLLESKLFKKILKQYENNPDEYNPFNLYEQKAIINSVINNYKNKYELKNSEDSIYFHLLGKYDSICKKAKKYYESETKKDYFTIDEVVSFINKNDKLCKSIWGKNYNNNASYENNNKNKKGFWYLILGFLLK